jgi:fucose permease
MPQLHKHFHVLRNIMRRRNYLLLSFVVFFFVGKEVSGQCASVPGTIQLTDTFSVKATEITVYDYTSFIVASNYDTTLFPETAVLQTLPYRELFDDLRNKQHGSFLKARGKGQHTFYF